ncbi:hypothetical protein ABZ403_25195 [Micromonospora zamorensis]|uniref:hypothetical protein n=1 Tax=Micromonospora zamorensis TaxID=709883 RepID=UPI0033F58C3A
MSAATKMVLRRTASVLAVPARVAGAYLIIWSNCSAMMSPRTGRDSAGPSQW